jgi:C_GCAxxG_C_C family probable redox protein
MVTLEQRLQHARELHRQGYNCAQCVMLCFVDDPTLTAASAALGGGVCGTGHICGAVSAMTMVNAIGGYSKPADKGRVYADGAALVAKFAAANNGQTDCRQLRVPGRKPCMTLIEEAVTLLHNKNVIG